MKISPLTHVTLPPVTSQPPSWRHTPYHDVTPPRLTAYTLPSLCSQRPSTRRAVTWSSVLEGLLQVGLKLLRKVITTCEHLQANERHDWYSNFTNPATPRDRTRGGGKVWHGGLHQRCAAQQQGAQHYIRCFRFNQNHQVRYHHKLVILNITILK